MTDIYKQKAIELLTPPFKYDRFGGYIWDSEHNMFADQDECELGTLARIRGWVDLVTWKMVIRFRMLWVKY